MIKRLEQGTADFEAFCKRDVFGTRVFGYFDTYGCESSSAEFYIQLDENKRISAVFSKIDGVLTLTAKSKTNFHELADFFKIIGFELLQTDAQIVEMPAFKILKKGHVLEYAPLENEISTDKNIKAAGVYQAEDIYEILKKAGFDGLAAREIWLADTVFRMKKEKARALFYEENAVKAACAMVLFKAPGAVLLGAVATLPEYRGRGLAGLLVKSLAEAEKEKNNTVRLLCADDGIINFYKKIGFIKVGDWAIAGME